MLLGLVFGRGQKFKPTPLGVSGWVTNVYDKPEIFGVYGGVEAVIQGEEEEVEKMIELLKKGPPVSRVSEVEIFWETPKENFDGFEIRK